MTMYATRFGAIDVPQDKRWICAEPMPGFEELREFALVQLAGQAPFIWLQSLEAPDLAFLMVDAACFGLRFPAREADPGGFDAPPYVLVILPQAPGEALRVHRLAPLLFNVGQARFLQRVFETDQVTGEGVWTGRRSTETDVAWHARLVEFQPPPLQDAASPGVQSAGRSSELAVS